MGKLSVKISDVSDSKPVVKNSDVSDSKPVVLPQPLNSTNHLVFKPDVNCKQLGTVSRSHYLKWDLMIFHQNIRGVNNKTDEIVNTVAKNPPHVLCFTERHLKTYQLDSSLFQNYKLGAKFCRKMYRNGGVCIYIHESFHFSNVNVHKFCKEKELEACVTKLYLPRCTIGIINIYRSPSRNFEYFLNNLEILLNAILSNSMGLIICGDFNINFLNNTTHKQHYEPASSTNC